MLLSGRQEICRVLVFYIPGLSYKISTHFTLSTIFAVVLCNFRDVMLTCKIRCAPVPRGRSGWGALPSAAAGSGPGGALAHSGMGSPVSR